MTTPELPKKTEPRVSALGEVRDRKIFYGQKSGAFFESDVTGMVPLTGARRRTFAELKLSGVIEPVGLEGLEEGRELMAPTALGRELILDWEV